MKQAITGFVFACLVISISGCGGGYGKAEEATKEVISSMNDISAALETVKDKETAKAAAPKIEAAAARFKAATKKAEGVKGTQAEKEKLEKEYLPKIQEASARMMKATMAAALSSGGEPSLQKALSSLK
jgi:hypothetical protein